jgi:hypothetical protein
MFELCMVMRPQYSDHARPTLHWATREYHAVNPMYVHVGSPNMPPYEPTSMDLG